MSFQVYRRRPPAGRLCNFPRHFPSHHCRRAPCTLRCKKSGSVNYVVQAVASRRSETCAVCIGALYTQGCRMTWLAAFQALVRLHS